MIYLQENILKRKFLSLSNDICYFYCIGWIWPTLWIVLTKYFVADDKRLVLSKVLSVYGQLKFRIN